MTNPNNSSIRMQVLWNRLLSLVEEQAQILIRTAFSPLVRSCGDVSVGVFDPRGRMLAQAVTGTPGHVNTMAESVRHFLDHFPINGMKEGDAFITNDPWMGTGHLNDFVVLTPSFHGGKCVALFCCTSHLMDVGGLGAGTEAIDVHSEGLYLPMLRLFDGGRVNETLLALIEANTRLPVDTVGDTYSLAACNDAGVRQLTANLLEFGLSDIDDLADHIVKQSHDAVVAAVRLLPKGQWYNEIILDGYDEPIKLCATVSISDDGVHIDFQGSAKSSRKGINVPLSYTGAYACFAITCAIAPDIPNNSGSLLPITFSAPKGCIVNAQKPAPVGARHIVGQMIPDLIFGCLAQAIPERVPAEGASAMWNIAVRGQFARGSKAGQPYSLAVTTSGGTGARFAKDGLSATAFPSGIHCMSIEIAETQVPFIFWRKELRADSGGPGRTRGGLGQLIEFENSEGEPFRLNCGFERIRNPAGGRFGGKAGAPGYVGSSGGERLPAKGTLEIDGGTRVVLHTPGGGGYGDVEERPLELIEADIRESRVSRRAAAADYARDALAHRNRT